MKKCSKCGETKAGEEFCILVKSVDGLYNICHACRYKNTKYRVAKYDQWLSLKKRALKELDISQDEFYSFVKEHEAEFQAYADAELSPSVDRIETFLPYKKSNLKVIGKPRPIKGVIGRNALGQEISFASLREASRYGYSRNRIVSAIKHNTSYKDFAWEYSPISV